MDPQSGCVAVDIMLQVSCLYFSMLWGESRHPTCYAHLSVIQDYQQEVFKTSIHISSSPVCQLTHVSNAAMINLPCSPCACSSPPIHHSHSLHFYLDASHSETLKPLQVYCLTLKATPPPALLPSTGSLYKPGWTHITLPSFFCSTSLL